MGLKAQMGVCGDLTSDTKLLSAAYLKMWITTADAGRGAQRAWEVRRVGAPTGDHRAEISPCVVGLPRLPAGSSPATESIRLCLQEEQTVESPVLREA